MRKKAWWSVDFGRLIIVYALEITPGKFELFEDGKPFRRKKEKNIDDCVNAMIGRKSIQCHN